MLSQTPHERPPRFYDHPNVILRVVVKEGFYCILYMEHWSSSHGLRTHVLTSEYDDLLYSNLSRELVCVDVTIAVGATGI